MWFGAVEVHDLERGQMVWSLLQGLFSQTSRAAVINIWGLGDSSLLQPQPGDNYMESRGSAATHTPSLPVVRRRTDNTLTVSSESDLSIFRRTHFYPSTYQTRL